MTIPAEWQSSLRGAAVAQDPEAQVRARELSDHGPMNVEPSILAGPGWLIHHFESNSGPLGSGRGTIPRRAPS